MSLASGTVDLHPELHNEFHFAKDTESRGCCCFWMSRPAKKSEYVINKQNTFIAKSKSTYRERLEANRRLAKIILSKFENDPIENDRAFELLKSKVNDTISNGDPITDDRLQAIISAIYEIKELVNVN